MNTYTTADQDFPAIASDSAGNFVAVWQSDVPNAGVFGQRYSSYGEALGPEFRVNTSTTYAEEQARVASDAMGNFVVIWSANLEAVLGQRFAHSGEPIGSEFTVASEFSYLPAVASDSAGNFVVIWSTFADIVARRFDMSGAPIGAEFVVNDPATGRKGHPSVASTASGDFVVTWEGLGEYGSGKDIFARRYSSSGAPAGGQFRVNDYTTGKQFSSSVAFDGSGNFVVVWNSYWEDGSDWGVFGQRYSRSGIALGSEFRINTYTTYFQTVPSVARGSTGDFVVTWSSYGPYGPTVDVMAQRFGADGAPLGGEFRINTYSTGDQGFTRVATNGRGSYVVVWDSILQDGSGSGIFGQLLFAAPSCLAGDVNGDGSVNVSDVFYLINALYAGGAAPICAGDLNGDGVTDVSDVFALINYLFAGGPAP